MITACTEPMVEVQATDGTEECPSALRASSVACENAGVMNGWAGVGPSHYTSPLALVTEILGASIAC